MRLRKVEGLESLSVEQTFYLIVDFLKDYIKEDQSTLDTVLKDWFETVDDEEYDESAEDLPITIPIEKKHSIEFALPKMECIVESNFSIYNADIHFKVNEDSFTLELRLPLLEDVMKVICGESSYNADVVYSETISKMSDVEKFVRKCEDILKAYTKSLNDILNILDKMDLESFSIYTILKDERKIYPDL